MTKKELKEKATRLYLGFDPGFDEKMFNELYSTAYSAVPAPKGDPTMESDEELRMRLVYITGEAELVRELRLGVKLDALAERYKLARRKKDREATQPIKREPLTDRNWEREYLAQWAPK